MITTLSSATIFTLRVLFSIFPPVLFQLCSFSDFQVAEPKDHENHGNSVFYAILQKDFHFQSVVSSPNWLQKKKKKLKQN